MNSVLDSLKTVIKVVFLSLPGIDYFSGKFLEETISIIAELLGTDGKVGNWVRRAGSQKEFKDKLDDKLTLGSQYGTVYKDFVNKLKTVSIE